MPQVSSTALNSCPSPAEWQAALHGQVDPVRWSEIEIHLTHCAECEARVDALTEASDSFVRHLCELPCTDADEPEFVALHAKLMASPSPYLNAEDEDAQLTREFTGPQSFGNYELLSLLGAGANGAVYKARHVPLDRLVTIKLLHPTRDSGPERRARFTDEVRALAKLEHPHLVRATDAGELDGCHYLVMEYLEGLDLSAVIRKVGPLPPGDAAEVVRQAALGLQHLADHGYTHRDIKPSNLLLTNQGQIKLLDFGLVRRPLDESRDDPAEARWAHGTADYMSPEQWRNYDQVDIRGDIYSLGCTFFKLLAGVPPYRPLPPGIASKWEAHCQAAIPDIRRYRLDVPDSVHRILARMLAKDPNQRIATPRALIAELHANCSGDLRRLAESAGLLVGRRPLADRLVLRLPTVREWTLLACAILLLIVWGLSRKSDSTTAAGPRPLATQKMQPWRKLEPLDTGNLLVPGDPRPIQSKPLPGTDTGIAFDTAGDDVRLIHLGQPLVGSFRLRVKVAPPLPIQGFGLAFKIGFSDEGSPRQIRFQSLSYVPDPAAPSAGRLVWNSHQGEFRGGRFELSEPVALAKVDVALPAGENLIELECLCGNGGLPDAWWCGKAVDPRSWDLTYHGTEASMVPEARLRTHYLGQVGLLCMPGRTLFCEPSLKYTASGVGSREEETIP